MFNLLWPNPLRVVPTVYPHPHMVARESHLCSGLQQKHAMFKFLKIEHHDSIVYSKHELILTFLAGATSDLTVGNTT